MNLSFKTPFTAFFQHPKWGMNWLLLTVCLLIPAVGPIVMVGWLLRCFAAWLEEKPIPEFSFDFFVTYLKQGLWPFLVTLVGMLAAMVIIMPLMFIGIATFVAMAESANAGTEEAPATGAILLMCGIIGAQFLVYAAVGFLLTPAIIRSGLRQDFGEGFKFAFVWDFIKRSWVHLLLAQLGMAFLWTAGTIIGYAALFVGVYFTSALLMFIRWHLHYQIYRDYLAKGGEQLPLDPSLLPVPPIPVTPSDPPALPTGESSP